MKLISMRRHPIHTLRARAAVCLFALWLPAGPLVAAAGACERAAARNSSRIGCHETASRPGCHDHARAQAAPAKPGCCCAKMMVASARCGCRHDGGAVAVTIDTTLPGSQFVISVVLPAHALSPLAPLARDVTPNAPPVPPPRAHSSLRSI